MTTKKEKSRSPFYSKDLKKLKSFSPVKENHVFSPNLSANQKTETNSLEEKNFKFLCAICNQPTLFCCSNCNNVFYCSQKHQEMHWKYHQSDCKEKLLKNKNFIPNLKKNDSKVDLNKFKEINENAKNFKEKNENSFDLLHEIEKERKLVSIYLLEKQISKSITHGKKLVQLSKNLLNSSSKDEFNNNFKYLSDVMVYIKVLLIFDNFNVARETLINSLSIYIFFY